MDNEAFVDVGMEGRVETFLFAAVGFAAGTQPEMIPAIRMMVRRFFIIYLTIKNNKAAKRPPY